MTRTNTIDQANLGLIKDVAGYYNEISNDLELYQDMNYTVLENQAKEHLMHWKKELRRLILGRLA